MNQGMELDQKLIVAIVKKGTAKIIVSKAKESGALGATILTGRGTATLEITKIWGLAQEPIKDVILILIKEELTEKVLSSIKEEGCLDKPGHGIAFLINANSVGGISMVKENPYELIVTIVDKGASEPIVEASKRGGAEGGTIIYGRGIGNQEKSTIFGLPIEPEKEVVITLIEKYKSEETLQAIVQGAELNNKGKGMVFTLPVEKVMGINGILEQELLDQVSSIKKE